MIRQAQRTTTYLHLSGCQDRELIDGLLPALVGGIVSNHAGQLLGEQALAVTVLGRANGAKALGQTEIGHILSKTVGVQLIGLQLNGHGGTGEEKEGCSLGQHGSSGLVELEMKQEK
jgi:hypothetical protein